MATRAMRAAGRTPHRWKGPLVASKRGRGRQHRGRGRVRCSVGEQAAAAGCSQLRATRIGPIVVHPAARVVAVGSPQTATSHVVSVCDDCGLARAGSARTQDAVLDGCVLLLADEAVPVALRHHPQLHGHRTHVRCGNSDVVVGCGR